MLQKQSKTHCSFYVLDDLTSSVILPAVSSWRAALYEDLLTNKCDVYQTIKKNFNKISNNELENTAVTMGAKKGKNKNKKEAFLM